MSHERFQSCIDACNECAIECIHCANACLSEQDVSMLTDCIRKNFECADICSTAARLMAGDSSFSEEICILCEKVCISCADECSNHSMDHCLRCAEVCRNCAEECRVMVQEKVA